LPVVTQTVHETAPATPVALAAIDPALMDAAAVPTTTTTWDDPTPILAWLWLGGAALVLAKLLAGLATLRRWTASASELEISSWSAAFARARSAVGCRRNVRLLVSDAPSPISWGWRRPVILLDRDTARDPAEADAVLAHEMAHIARHDWVMLILARLAVACFWFNPLVWLLERSLIEAAEEAADARALATIEPEAYAQTLLSCARQVGMPRLPATAIADKSLGRRVKAILGRRLRVGTPDPRLVRAAMALCALVAAPIAALKPVVATIYAPARAPAPAIAPAAVAPAAPEAPDSGLPRIPTAIVVRGTHVPPTPAAPVAPAAETRPASAALLTLAAAEAPRAPVAPVTVATAAVATSVAPVPPAPPPPPAPDDWSSVDGRALADSIRRSVRDALDANREALRQSARASAEVRRVLTPERMAQIRRAAEEARRAGAEAQLAAREGLIRGGLGMEEGARGMERGARQMDEEAEKLRSPAYRAEQIARAAREGRTETDAELVAAIPKLHEGAAEMRRGAERMRREGERMRRGE
jgi:beta-lactamase regulating signal transducer with metallopeptidase domain